jgi:VanZ family protein
LLDRRFYERSIEVRATCPPNSGPSWETRAARDKPADGPPTVKALRRIATTITADHAVIRAWRVLTVLLAIAVGYLALAPHPPPGIDMGWDKLNHASAFTALAFSASLSCPGSRRARLLLLCGLLAYGGLIELLQTRVPPRTADARDLLADAVGIACGAAIAALVLRVAAAAPERRR